MDEENNDLSQKEARIVTPQTIEELQQWYIEHNLPDEEKTRFFIGKNYKGARAFGIYKDEITSNIVVYKNKSDGSRAIRYEGTNESFAVNEIWTKLKEEIQNQKANNQRLVDEYRAGSKYEYGNKKSRVGIMNWFVFVPFILMFGFEFVISGVFGIVSLFSPQKGYYYYGNEYYYYQSGSWYKYNEAGNWEIATPPKDLKENRKRYYQDNYSNGSGFYYNINRFEDSSFYIEPSYSSSDSSSSSSSSDDYSWSSDDSWDSSSSDWDSDW